jgi:hypothetical protein
MHVVPFQPAAPSLEDAEHPGLDCPPVAVDEIAQIVHAGEALQRALERAVIRHRLAGASWADVGRSLGISRQSAQQRFRHLDLGQVHLVVEDGRAAFISEVLGEQLHVDAGRRQVLDAGRRLRAVATAAVTR